MAEAIHRHDAHHLFLGGRFAVNMPEVVAACAQYCDVVSFNVYADLPQHGFDAAAIKQLEKPALISEFHFGSEDRGPFGKGVVSVYTEKRRGEAYAKFVAAAATDPNIVGAHWFEYIDQPVTGRRREFAHRPGRHYRYSVWQFCRCGAHGESEGGAVSGALRIGLCLLLSMALHF